MAVIHPQVLGIGQRLLDRMEPIRKTDLCFGNPYGNRALPVSNIFLEICSLLQFDDQDQRLFCLTPLARQHGVDSAADGSLIFQSLGIVILYRFYHKRFVDAPHILSWQSYTYFFERVRYKFNWPGRSSTDFLEIRMAVRPDL